MIMVHNKDYNSESFSRHLQDQESNSDVSFTEEEEEQQMNQYYIQKRFFLSTMILTLL